MNISKTKLAEIIAAAIAAGMKAANAGNSKKDFQQHKLGGGELTGRLCNGAAASFAASANENTWRSLSNAT